MEITFEQFKKNFNEEIVKYVIVDNVIGKVNYFYTNDEKITIDDASGDDMFCTFYKNKINKIDIIENKAYLYQNENEKYIIELLINKEWTI